MCSTSESTNPPIRAGAMVPIAGIVLLMFLGLSVDSSPVAKCTEQKGIPLKWIQPFSICGGVVGVREGFNASFAQHYPLLSNGKCLIACVNVTVSRVNFTLEWCAHRREPTLQLRHRMQEMDFSVDRANESVTFYGCTTNYVAVIEMETDVSCIAAPCRTILLYVRERSELPRPYSFHPVYTDRQAIQKLPANGISPILHRLYRKWLHRRGKASKMYPPYWSIGSFVSFTLGHYLYGSRCDVY
uniref:Uncharacterized protein n=1 Tax=Anopheles maculatus TaxID=74869 RepID=A0A182SMM0_9DIPT